MTSAESGLPHVLLIQTWHRLTCVCSSPAFKVDGVGFLNISLLSMVASQKLYALA